MSQSHLPKATNLAKLWLAGFAETLRQAAAQLDAGVASGETDTLASIVAQNAERHAHAHRVAAAEATSLADVTASLRKRLDAHERNARLGVAS